MMNPGIAFCVFILEMLICYIFFSNIFGQKRPSWVCLLWGILFAGIGTAGNLLSHNSGVVNTVITVLVQSLFAYLCFNAKLYIGFFYSLVLAVINGTIEIFVISSYSSLLSVRFQDYNSSLLLLIMECTTCKSLYFLIVLLISRIANPDSGRKKLPLTLFFYPAACSVCLILFWHINTEPGLPIHIQLRLSVAGVLHMVATILLFITYQHQLEKESKAIHMQNEIERLQVEKSYYDILEQQNNQLMIYAHDAKNHLAAIESLTNDPQITQYISALSRQLANYSKNCHSGNKLLDVMIGKYVTTCESKGIRFDYDVKLCSLREVADMDLVAILGNLMDNAVTAAENSEEKWISLETARRNTYRILIIRNSCHQAPQLRSDGYTSTKEDPHLHGFGLKSVAQVLKKYDGDFDCSFDPESHCFTVTAMIGELCVCNP